MNERAVGRPCSGTSGIGHVGDAGRGYVDYVPVGQTMPRLVPVIWLLAIKDAL
jgi:hypothetical protein